MDALMLENMEITFVVAEKQICAILLTEPAKIENIRVLLLDNDNTVSYTHLDVYKRQLYDMGG